MTTQHVDVIQVRHLLRGLDAREGERDVYERELIRTGPTLIRSMLDEIEAARHTGRP